MSEAEFDSYLSLLSKFLRLRSRQRTELADELRDHLDSRLDELLAAGKTREQAVQIALEEFGDAALLAEDFSRLASRRSRRFVMRCTAASAAVVAAVVLLSVALAPPGPNGPGPREVAAQPAPAETSPNAALFAEVPATKYESPVEQRAIGALDVKLSQVVKAEFEGVPLREVLHSIANSIEADVLIDERGVADEAIHVDEPVTLTLTRTPLSARTVLEFVLEPRGLTLVNRSGVIYVTTVTQAEELLVTKVHNVRDLLENATTHTGQPGMMGGGGMGGGGLGGGGFFSIQDTAAAALLAGATTQFGGEGAGQAGPVLYGAAAELVDTIQQTTSGPWMATGGSGGTIALFDGLLVIRQNEQNHAEIQKLLDALREAGRRQPGGTVTVPQPGDASTATGASQPAREAGEFMPGARSSLGLVTTELTEAEWQAFQAVRIGGRPRGDRRKVAKVKEVSAGGPAELAGLKAGDVISAVNILGAFPSTPPGSVTEALALEADRFVVFVSRRIGDTFKEFEYTIRPDKAAPSGGETGAADRPPTRDEFERKLAEYGPDENTKAAVLAAFRQSGARRTLCPATLIGYCVNFGDGPLNEALRSLNVEPESFVSAANQFMPKEHEFCPPSAFPLLDEAKRFASERGEGGIRTHHVAQAVLAQHREAVEKALSGIGLSVEELEARLSAGSGASPSEGTDVDLSP